MEVDEIYNIVYPYMAEVEEIYNLACPAAPIHYQVAAFPPCDCRPSPSRPSSALFSESSTFFIWPATRDAVSCTPARARSTETLSSIPRPVGVIPPSEAQRSTTET